MKKIKINYAIKKTAIEMYAKHCYTEAFSRSSKEERKILGLVSHEDETVDESWFHLSTEPALKNQYKVWLRAGQAALDIAETLTVEKSIQKKEIYAKNAYEVYCEKVGGIAFNGDKLPSWEEFSKDAKKQKQAEAWRAVGEYIVSKLIERTLTQLK